MKAGDGSPEHPTSQCETMLPPPSGIDEYSIPVAGDTPKTLSFPITSAPPSVNFSAPERAVLRGVAAGKDNDEIADERGCSRRTVTNLVRSICAKLKLPSRLELESYLAAEAGRVAVLDLRASNSLGGLARERQKSL
ncbi:MAG: helix-turn-helix transcriptional regulator [Polyangiaceae bacterium]